MDFSIPTVLEALSSAGNALKELNAWRTRARGDERVLIGELKDNLYYLDMVVENDVPLDKVINRLSIKEYKKLDKRGYNFNVIKRRPIAKYPSLIGTDLEAWRGKQTGELIESIYDKLNELKIKYPYIEKNRNFRWKTRVNNIRKRIWLLLKHVRH